MESESESECKDIPFSVVYVMDKSGSMSSMGTEPVDGLNNFYANQKTSGEFFSTLILFNDVVEFIYKNMDGKEIKDLSYSEYAPNGMTALYDAIGAGIEYQKGLKTKNVIFVVLTDGLENASRNYSKKSIGEIITNMEKEHNWKFLYLGANQDSFEVGSGIGINTTVDFDYSQEGCRNVMRTVSDTVARCITGEDPEPVLQLPKCELPKNPIMYSLSKDDNLHVGRC